MRVLSAERYVWANSTPVNAYGSKRQACIACSSTEAEIIAASQAALETVYFRRLLEELGLAQDGATPLFVDNSGAVELSRDRKSCNRSRHIDRRFFKVRELQAGGHLTVTYVDTAANAADVLTKALPLDAFLRHCATLSGRVAHLAECACALWGCGSGVAEGGVGP